jgi:hypothetical protein
MEKIFANGLFFKRPNDNAPEYVKGALAVKVTDFIPFLEKNKNEEGWVRLDLKEAVNGKLYFQLNTFVPGNKSSTTEPPSPTIHQPLEYPTETINIDDIPF